MMYKISAIVKGELQIIYVNGLEQYSVFKNGICKQIAIKDMLPNEHVTSKDKDGCVEIIPLRSIEKLC